MRTAAVFLLFAVLALRAEQWRLQYFYDEDSSTLTINDLQFPSARRGIAVGYLTEKGKNRPAALLTSDGGEHWSLTRPPEIGLSLFFLNESVGWMVTREGLWRTDESGRSWRKLKSPEGILRVHFQDPQHGWAIGLGKGLYETNDGGQKWTRVTAADEVKADPDYTVYAWIVFADPRVGLVSGWSRPPRRGDDRRLPDWLEPEKAQRRREWPNLTIFLETRNGGATWKPSVTSLFGRVTRIRLTPGGLGLGLIEFSNAFDWPAEVFHVDWRSGKSTRVFRRKDRAVTDIALLPNGRAYLAAIETQGQRVRLPLPGKLRILASDDLAAWREMEVDYRAFAGRALLAAADPAHVWVATDSGMILKLAAE